MAQYQLAGTAALASVTSSPALIQGIRNEFRNILKCTIPATKVSAPLVDFPVPIHIDSAAGTGDLDLSSFFDSIRDATVSYCNDDFDTLPEIFGTTWSIDRYKWYWTQNANSSYMRYENGKLKINFTSNYVRMAAMWGLKGDFDLQWDFDCTGATHVNGWYYGISLEAASGNNFSVWRCYNGADRYRTNMNGSSIDYATSDHTGKIRMTRSGSTMTAYYWDGDQWQQLRQVTDHANDFNIVYIDAQTWISLPNPTVYMDNFQINSGTPLWKHWGPEVSKLYAFDENNRPLPIDVDTLDHINEKAILHVKVPYISATVDTNVYIAWDDAKEDNPLCGWTSSAAARQAYDDNFLLVSHNNCFGPNFALGLRLDQAIKENELGAASNNALDEADIVVSTSHGRCLNFDTERYTFSESSWMEPAGELTLEAYAYLDVAANWAGLIGKDLNIGGRQYALIITSDGYPRMMVNGINAVASVAISPATWYYFAGRFDPSTFIKTRQDKAEVASETSTPPSSIGAGTTDLQFGVFYQDSTTYMLDGRLGEVRMSDVCRSEAWCDVTSDGLHDNLLSLYAIKKQLGGTAAIVSTTSTPDLKGPWDLGGTAAVQSVTSTPILEFEGAAGALPVIVVVT